MPTRYLLLLAALCSLFGDASGADQSAKKIVLIAGPKSHGPTGNGIHDYPWSVKLLKVMLDHSNVREQVRVEYHLDGMPRDLKTLDDADTIMVISDGRDGDLYQEAPHFGSPENLAAVQKQMDRGCGFLTFHFSTFAPDQYAKQIIDWSGGYFDWETDGKKKWHSAITHKEADISLGTPGHAVLRGIKPFKMKEEFYFNLRFADDGAKADGLSPLFVVPALNGREPDGNVVAWAKQRANGGRGFGTTCGHFYANWERDEFRKLILNAIAWTAKLDVPASGVEARYFTHAEITNALAGVEGTQHAQLDEKPIRILLLAGNDAHKWHNWEKTTPAIKAALERDPRIKVDVSLDIEDLGKKDIAKNYDLLIPNYVNWHDPKPLSDASKTAFMNFVQNGGGVLFIHFNSSAFHFSLPMGGESDWPEYRKIALRVWNHHGKDEAKSGHDAFGPFKVDVTTIEHPITAGLKGFDVIDELYFKQDGRPVEPLITAKSKVTGRDEPLAFVGSYGKGRVFQTLLGHSEKTYDVFEPREMLRRAAAWATGRRVIKLRAEDDPIGARREGEAPAEPRAPANGSAGASPSRAVVLAPGKFGQALDARATGVAIEAKPEQRSVPITVECWTKLEAKTGFNILVASEPKSSATHWELYSYAGGGFFSVYLPGCGGEYRSDVVIADDKWHHVAMALEAKRIRLFVDGKPALEKPLPNEFGGSKSGHIGIGRLVEGGIGCAGLIDEVRIRRGAHAIDGLPDKAPVLDDDTVGLWHCDELIDKTKLKDDSKSQTPAMAQASSPPSALGPKPSASPKPPAHWGKEQIGFDQWEGDWVDNRWKESQIGRWLSSVVALPGGAGRKMTSIRVGDQQQATVCFDAQTAQMRAIWTGGFLKFNPARFGIIGAPTPDGPFYFETTEGAGWPGSKIQHRGMHSHGERVVLSYLVDGVPVLESPWCEMLDGEVVVTRTLEVGPSDKALDISGFESTNRIDSQRVGEPWLMQEQGPAGHFLGVKGWPEVQPHLTSNGGVFRATFRLPPHKETRRLKLVYWVGLATDRAKYAQRLAATSSPKPATEPELALLTQPGPAKWTEKIETEFKLAANDAPYVVDTFKLPFDNPYKALLFTSGHDFMSNGDIVVCTVHGDVWRVRGAESRETRVESQKLRWQRIATGLHQPLGLVVVRGSKSHSPPLSSPLSPQQDAIYVLGRDQITRLHDTNADGETDFYECFSNVYPTSTGGHDYITCLERDSVGNFWFVHANLGIVRVSADGQKFEVISTGLRNPNGMGLGPGDVVTAAPQEGDWTPASAIFVAKPGAHFGGGGPRITPERPLGYDPPAVWIPRRVDNSSGGQTWVTSDQWGPLTGHMLHFSFGQCSAMLVGGLGREAQGVKKASDAKSSALGPRPLALGPFITEFPFRFDSGAMRGRFSPHDGQLYVTGLRGWTTSAVTDGCLQRVRYTGLPIDMPVLTTAYSNGIAITFTDSLDKNTAENPGNFHVEQWNYLYSKNYGSPEYRVSDPKQEGRDQVRVRSATLIDERTVFLELKDAKPVNVLAVSCALRRLELRPEARFQAPLGNEQSRDFRRTLYLTLNSVRPDKFDESKLVRRVPIGGLNEAQEAGLRPGLIARFRSHVRQNVGDTPIDPRSGERGYEDARVDRLAATFVKTGSSPTPYLKSGPFVARWEGFIRVPLRLAVTFSIEGSREAKLFVNDKEVATSGIGFQSVAPKQKNDRQDAYPTMLNGGFNKLAIEFTSPTDNSNSQFRLIWESAEFAREPVPPTVLFHNGDDIDLLKGEQLRRGRELFLSHHCRNCHAPLQAGATHDPEPPRLMSQTRNLDWMARWLQEPTSFVPHARMPFLFNGDAQQARHEVLAIIAQLEAPAAINAFREIPKDGSVQEGAQLYEDLSCVSCHRFTQPQIADSFDRRSLAHLNQKFRSGRLDEFLRSPQAAHPGTRMPEFRLTLNEERNLSAYLRSKAMIAPHREPLTLEGIGNALPETIKRMQSELLTTRSCVRCHAIGASNRVPMSEPLPITDVRSAGGCLAELRHARAGIPWFALVPADRAALVRFLETDKSSLNRRAPVEEAQSLVRSLRCAACHDRDAVISPRRAIIAEESDSGIPPEVFPNLTWAGEKLYAGWTEKFLQRPSPQKPMPFSVGGRSSNSAGSVSERYAQSQKLKPGETKPEKPFPSSAPLRPWLKGRMPSFPHDAETLAQGLAAEHGLDPLNARNAFAPNEQLAEFGNALTQKTALDCRQCHAVGNQPAQGDDKTKIAPGINFAIVQDRLRYDYYQRFTLDPPRFDINSKMPKLAADGKTTKVTTILDGDARQQFDAVWHFIQAAQIDPK